MKYPEISILLFVLAIILAMIIVYTAVGGVILITLETIF